jgi:hypothetical protein
MPFNTTSETMGSRLTDLIGWELEQSYCRDLVTLTDAEVSMGAVLARDASGDYLAIAPAATDGTEVPRAIAIEDGSAEGQVVVLRRACIVKAGALVWPDGTTDTQKSAAIEALADAGVLVRDDV